jgi:hypothetical protein
MEHKVKQERSLRQRVVFVLRPVVIVGVLLAMVVPFAAGVIFARALTISPCTGGESPAVYDLPFEEITFPSSAFGSEIKGYFIPGDNGATLISPPTGSSARGNWMHEIAVLHKHGYSVLSFDSRSCMGQVLSLGYTEVREVGDALDYLATRPDVDMEKVGIHGFSTGGATAMRRRLWRGRGFRLCGQWWRKVVIMISVKNYTIRSALNGCLSWGRFTS